MTNKGIQPGYESAKNSHEDIRNGFETGQSVICDIRDKDQENNREVKPLLEVQQYETEKPPGNSETCLKQNGSDVLWGEKDGHTAEKEDSLFKKCLKCKCEKPNPHWGWVIVGAAFVSNFIVTGFDYSCGLFYVEWMEYFVDDNSRDVSMISSINMGLLGLAGPLGAVLSQRFGDKLVVILSGILASVGLIVAAFAQSVLVLNLSFGLVTGIGVSFAYNTICTLPAHFFDERSLGLAIGISSSGGGCGLFFMPLLIERLIETYSWRGTLLILSGILLNLCVSGALLRTPKNMRREKSKLVDMKLFKSLPFVLFASSQVLFSVGYCATFVHIAAAVESQTGVVRTYSAIIISVIGVSNCVGRLVQGAIGGRTSHVVAQYCLSFIFTSGALLIFPSIQSFPVLVVLATVFGFGTAPFVTISQIMLKNMVGVSNLKIAWGIFMFTSGFGFIAGAPMAGLLFDYTGDYKYSMYFAGATILAHLLFLIKPLISESKVTESYIL